MSEEIRNLAIGPDSRLRMQETILRREGAGVILGCPAVGRFLEIDEHTVVAVEALQRGATVREAEIATLERTGVDYDLLQLVELLVNRGFVLAIDDRPIEGLEDLQPQGITILSGIRAAHLGWLRSRVTFVALGAIVLAYGVLALHDARFRPSHSALSVSQDPFTNILVAFAALLFFAFLHEMGHVLVARSHGLAAPIRMSQRFYLIVLQTDVTNAWVLPRASRIQIFLAGIATNAVLLSLAGIARAFVEVGSSGSARFDILTALDLAIYVNSIPILFQFFVFARTDLYYVVATLLGERNLMADSFALLGYRVRRVVMRLRRPAAAPCPHCAASVLATDAFCESCRGVLGRTRASEHTFRHRDPAKLAAWGIFALAGGAVAVGYFSYVIVTVISAFGEIALRNFLLSLNDRDWTHAGRAGAVILVLGLQVAFFATMLGRLAWRTGKATLRLARDARDARPSTEA